MNAFAIALSLQQSVGTTAISTEMYCKFPNIIQQWRIKYGVQAEIQTTKMVIIILHNDISFFLACFASSNGLVLTMTPISM